MTHWIPLHASHHRHAAWLRFQNYGHTAEFCTAPVVVAELNELLPHYALGFIKTDHGTYELVALLGTEKNAYLADDGCWLASYVPAFFRGFPFSLQQNAKKPGQTVLCAHTECGLFFPDKASQEEVQGKLEPLFTEQGEQTDGFKSLIGFLTQTAQNRQLTIQLAGQLHQAGLLVPWSLPETIADQPQQTELYRIEESHLKQLPGETLATLAGSGALTLAYAQLLTQGRLKDLQKRQEQQTQPKEELDLDQVFGESEQDIFRF